MGENRDENNNKKWTIEINEQKAYKKTTQKTHTKKNIYIQININKKSLTPACYENNNLCILNYGASI